MFVRFARAGNIKTTAGKPLPLRNASDEWSLDDFNATVRALLTTHQNLYGFRVGECKNLDSLPTLMDTVDRLDPGGSLQIFAWLSSHEGHGSSLYCEKYVDAKGHVSWTLVATTLAKLSLKYPRLVGFSIDVSDASTALLCRLPSPTSTALACGFNYKGAIASDFMAGLLRDDAAALR